MNAEFFAAGRAWSAVRPLVIAELGTGHAADPGKARELIVAAAEAGADCVKFQTVYADEILHPETGTVPLPGGNIRLYDVFKNLEVKPEFFAEMKECAENRGLIFLSTPFGPRSAAELFALGPALVKIASPELNYVQLLRQVSGFGLPVLLSTGVSRLSDIETALETLAGPETGPAAGKICLLHCVTAYPAPETDYNLRVLDSLRAVFGVPVGLSDHSLDPVLVPVLALSRGAAVIEKHFCLSRADPGLDDPIALPPEDFALMVRSLREAARRIAAGEGDALLAAVKRERGEALVEAVLGDGTKRLSPAERQNYGRTNRSVHALRRIAAGETITAEALAVLRTEKKLRPGLPPPWRELLPGRVARRDIPPGEGITLEDI